MASPERLNGSPKQPKEIIIPIKTHTIRGRLTRHGLLLKAVRAQNEIPAATMARLAGVDRPSYHKIENHEVYPRKEVTRNQLPEKRDTSTSNWNSGVF